MSKSINLDEPRYDQSTYWGRAQHFFTVTNPLNVLASERELDKAKEIYMQHKKGENTPGITEDELWRAKYLYDSAFHPDTGEKMLLIGRMSAQVPMNMTITGCMMTFYKSTPAVFFWQWVNQSFNAIVNYTNRSGDAPISLQESGMSYVFATSGAVATALGLNSLAKSAPPLLGRLVPFAAVGAANCINIPLMRRSEITNGIPVTDDKGKKIGQSGVAAKKAITQVTFSRIGMAVPSMDIVNPALLSSWSPPRATRRPISGAEEDVCSGPQLPQTRRRKMSLSFAFLTGYIAADAGHIRSSEIAGTINMLLLSCRLFVVLSPILMNSLDKRGFLRRFPLANAPIQTLFCGLCLTFATPLCCALFSQKASIAVDDLEPELQEKIRQMKNPPSVVYYNKGL